MYQKLPPKLWDIEDEDVQTDDYLYVELPGGGGWIGGRVIEVQPEVYSGQVRLQTWCVHGFDTLLIHARFMVWDDTPSKYLHIKQNGQWVLPELEHNSSYLRNLIHDLRLTETDYELRSLPPYGDDDIVIMQKQTPNSVRVQE